MLSIGYTKELAPPTFGVRLSISDLYPTSFEYGVSDSKNINSSL